MSTVVDSKFSGTTYSEASAFVQIGATPKRIANNTWIQRNMDGTISITLHRTKIITYRVDGAVILNSGGYRTVTTRNRLRQYMPKWMALHVCRGRWTISFTYGESFSEAEAVREVDFVDGLTLFATNATSR